MPSTIAEPLSKSVAAAGGAPRGGCAVIGCAARLAAMKGLDVLVRALPLVLQRARGRPVQLWLAGDGPQREPLEALARDLGVAAQARFLGHCGPAEMARFWAAVDIYALPSRWEGLPLSIIEAMAHGTPVVASTLPGVAEAVVDGETGLLVPLDAVESLATALAALIDDDARREALGRAGRARFLFTFQVEVVIERLLAAYQCVVPCTR